LSGTCVVLQSSYLPWRGYFDLVAQADVFVFLDGVQYTKQDWRNRNQIMTANGPLLLTVPVHAHDRMDRTIAEIEIDHSKPWVRKHLGSLRHAYSQAPFRDEVLGRVEGILDAAPRLLFDLNRQLVVSLWDCLSGGMDKEFVADESLTGAVSDQRDQRVIDICKQVGADRYLSGPAARDYVQPDIWDGCGIELEYIEYDYLPYRQQFEPFLPNMSIVDVLMNMGPGSLAEAMRSPD